MALSKILIVEDEAIVAKDIKTILENSGYIISGTVSSGVKAIKSIEKCRPDLVLMDIALSGEMDGIDAANQINVRYNTPVLFLTAHMDAKRQERVKIKEPFNCMLKPFEEKELLATIKATLDRHKGERTMKAKEEHAKQNLDEYQKVLEATTSALASLSEIRDPFTTGHQARVTCLASAIAHDMGLSKGQINGIQMAGYSHDIGKIYVPVEILNRPGHLTHAEYDIVKSHPQDGYDVIKTIEFPWPVAHIVLQHHERLDGSGYPQGLKDNSILLEAKILAVADVVEAMSSQRSFRKAHSMKVTLEEISNNKGILYEREVVNACLRQLNEKGFRFE